MSPHHLRFPRAALALTLVAAPITAQAQSIHVSAARLWTNHDLLADVRGVSLSGELPFGEVVSLRLGYDWMRGSTDRVVLPCAGLVPPGADCTPEPMRETSRIAGPSVALAFAVLRRDRVDLRVVPTVRGVTASSTLRRASGRDWLGASNTELAADIGLEAELRPDLASPVSLHVAVRAGAYSPMEGVDVVDGYAPLTEGFRATRVEAGLTLDFARLRSR
jgi:hypothetical protein